MKNIMIPTDLLQQVKSALTEDIGTGDVTADLIPHNKQILAHVISRDKAVVAGKPWFDQVFKQIDDAVSLEWACEEGDKVAANTHLCTLYGSARSILMGERCALNFYQTLSAVATRTARYVDAVQSTRAQILDTRKTLPGLRTAQKYAVTCGGGKNHRIGLYDQVLIKENHILAAGSITQAVRQARYLHPQLKVEVETETLDEFQEALAAGADIIMLDNFQLAQMREAVAISRALERPIPLEVSGGVTLETIRAIAETGVDYISVGELTKHIQAIDLSMRFVDKN